MWDTLLIVLCLLFSFVYYITTRKFGYWKEKKVPHPRPVPLFGNYGDFILLRTFIGDVATNIYKQFPNEPYVGVYFGTEPTLLVQDPELLKLIMTKDFHYCNGREASHYSENEPITKGVFFNYGDDWKVVRQNLSPLFSTAKMKNMFPLIEKCTVDFEKLLKYKTSISNVFEMKLLMSRFTIDSMGSCVFGIEINLLQEDYVENPYRKLGDMMFERSDLRGYLNIVRSIWPAVFYALGFNLISSQVYNSLVELITKVSNLRQNKPSSRNDFVDLLLSLKANEYLVGDSMGSTIDGDSNKVYKKLDNELMGALCFALFAGGFEPSASTLTMTLFEVAKNKEAQVKVQQEIDEYLVKHNNKLEYDCVTELPYLSACIDEAMRLHPLFTVLTREVIEDYTLPTGLQLDKGVRIHIPIHYIHLNPNNFPKPNHFRPERFLSEERNQIKPYTYFPFGEGPRICIGARFGRMQVIAGMITVLKDYNLKLAEGMPETVAYDPRMIVTKTLDDIYLELERRVI